MFNAFIQIVNILFKVSFTWTITFDISLLYLSFRFFFCRAVLCKLLNSSRFARCSYPMFFWLVVVPHIDSITWMIYGRLSIHKMFGTNPVVFAWLPVFPCFRVFSIDRFNPLLSLFRVSFQCWKRIKLKKVRTCTMAIMRSAKPLPPFLQLIRYVLLLQPTTAQILISLCKNPCARNFLSQNTVIVEKLNSSKSKQLLSRLVPSRTKSCDRPLELRTRLLRNLIYFVTCSFWTNKKV